MSDPKRWLEDRSVADSIEARVLAAEAKLEPPAELLEQSFVQFAALVGLTPGAAEPALSASNAGHAATAGQSAALSAATSAAPATLGASVLKALGVGALVGTVEKGATPPGSGTLSMGVSNVGQCRATSVSVRYNLGVIMGEPTVGGTWSFEGEEGCSPPANTVVWLRLSTGSGYGFVRLDPSVPTANRGPGYNSTGSPNWNQLVCAFNGSGPAGCMNEAQARAIWANGQVTGFVMGW